MIDPNLSEEVRITVIATGVDKTREAHVPPEAPRAQASGRPSGSHQITLPYDASSQITREYPPPQVPPRKSAELPKAVVVEDAEVDMQWAAAPDINELTAVERALARARGRWRAGARAPRALAADGRRLRPAQPRGPGPGQPAAERKKALPRPSLKSVLGDDMDAELDVPTFIRRHNAQT